MVGRTRKQRSRARRIVRAIGHSALGALAIGVAAFFVWTQLVMFAEPGPLGLVAIDDAIQVSESESAIVMTPTAAASSAGAGVGLVFIPGAKVDPAAYESNLAALVDHGVTVVITKPILNLAFFDQRPLSTFTAQAPGMDTWLVGGHSLGGVRACQYAGAGADSDPAVSGLVLFGSYCANDLSESDLAVLSISGSEDGLSTPAKIQDAAHLLPASAEFDEIDGVNHADFGDYGVQPGDGTSTVPDDNATAQIAVALLDFVDRLAR